MKPAQTVLLIALALVLTAPAQAQTCFPTDTPTTCFTKFNTVDASAFKTASATVANTIATTNTGTPELNNVASTSLRDFLSIFTAVARTSTVSDSNGAITLDYNLPLNLRNENDIVKFQATFEKPDLDPALKTALGTDTTTINSLTDAFDETDDITASVSYSPTTDRFGRTYANHDDLVEALLSAVDIGLAAENPNRLNAKVGDLARGTALGPDTPFTVITDGAKQAQVLAAFEAFARAQPKYTEKISSILTNASELINNQEQIYFGFQYHDLDPLAGATSWALKGTYEMGGKNISKFIKATKCDAAAILRDANRGAIPGQTSCLQKFNDYAGPDEIDRGWRIAASIDLAHTDSNSISVPQLSAPITSAKSESQIITLTAGRRLDPPTSTHERRIDFAASYENVSDDPNRDDRLIGSVTWTQELTNSMTLPITISYANKSKFLPQDDKHLSAHFAISYKIPDLTN